MKRNSTESLWIEQSSRSTYPVLKGKTEVDVAIIGAGITGLTAAILLKQAGRSVAVLESHHVGTGESGHTTAHLTEFIDRGYAQLISDFGLEGAQMAAQSSRTSIEQIYNLMKSLKIECGFERLPGYIYSEDRRGVFSLKKELRALKKVGIRAEYQKDIPLPIKVKGAIRIDNQAQFHPRKYLLGLAKAIHGNAEGKTSYIYENSIVREVSEEGDFCSLKTDRGEVIAQQVIVATHSPSFSRITLPTKIAAYRTYAVAAKLKTPHSEEIHARGLFWDTADPYHYIRSQETDKGTYWIIGGEDHKTGMEEKTQKSFDHLKKYAEKRFEVESWDYQWSGQIIEPMDGLPFIGLNPGSSHLYVATGYSGNGMTFGTVAGMLCSDLILGRANAWSNLYHPGRIHAKASASTFLAENKDFPLCFIKDRLASPNATSLSEVGAGEGKIVKINGTKAAVYRNPDGDIQAVSPVCTHMGCYVRFNDSEKSWDCPCHGSRFATDGEVLNGPAKKNLEPVALEELQEIAKRGETRKTAA